MNLLLSYINYTCIPLFPCPSLAIHSTPNLVSTSITNTRQLGTKKTIELTRGTKGTFGFGLASRDVATNTDEIPVYVKSISSGGPAFQDGRLKIGDRVLEVSSLLEFVVGQLPNVLAEKIGCFFFQNFKGVLVLF